MRMKDQTSTTWQMIKASSTIWMTSHKSVLQRGPELLRPFSIPVCLALVCPTLGGPPQLYVALDLVLPHFCGHQTPDHHKSECSFLHLYTFTELNHLVVYGSNWLRKPLALLWRVECVPARQTSQWPDQAGGSYPDGHILSMQPKWPLLEVLKQTTNTRNNTPPCYMSTCTSRVSENIKELAKTDKRSIWSVYIFSLTSQLVGSHGETVEEYPQHCVIGGCNLCQWATTNCYSLQKPPSSLSLWILMIISEYSSYSTWFLAGSWLFCIQNLPCSVCLRLGME